jgi:hypothetical protein
MFRGLVGLAAALSLAGTVPAAWALEFVAEQITRIDGHSRKASIYYRDDRWRIEHNDLGPVNVTIARKDRKIVWHLLSRLKLFKTLALDEAQAPRVAVLLDGEVGREEIGTEILDGHPTTLYEVTVATNMQQTEVFYQWLATDIHFPLKLAKKNGNWIIEYRRVKLRPVSEEMFQLPLNYLPLEEFNVQSEQSP